MPHKLSLSNYRLLFKVVNGALGPESFNPKLVFFEHSYQNVLVLVLQRDHLPSLFKYAHKLPVQNANQTNTLAVSPLFSNSPLSADSQQLLRSIRGKSARKFPDKPYKVNKIVLICPILGFVLIIYH